MKAPDSFGEPVGGIALALPVRRWLTSCSRSGGGLWVTVLVVLFQLASD